VRIGAGPNPAPDDDNILGGIATGQDTLWAVGHFKDNGRQPLIMRHPAEDDAGAEP
jgi:hypothetical protein